MGKKSFWPLLLALMLALGAVVSAQDEVATQPESSPLTNQIGETENEAGEMPSLTESVLPSLTRIAISLIIIVAIIYATIFLLKKLSGNRIGGRKGKAIEVVEQTYLAPKKSVCLLKLADRAVLVGITEQNINMLTEFNWEDLPEQTVEKGKRLQTGFPGLLNEAAGKLFGGRANKGAERESTV
jgi:flagellar protein FliO/FliZ